jgi:hypothetical protein
MLLRSMPPDEQDIRHADFAKAETVLMYDWTATSFSHSLMARRVAGEQPVTYAS